jgi:outer membrane protein assembly factor BamB
MRHTRIAAGVIFGCVTIGTIVSLADWPQWRGENRDGRVTDFTVPAQWPKEPKQAWSVQVGDGVATPALVGDRLYVFSRQNDNEVTRCLQAADGKEVWLDKYPAQGATGAAGSFPGPRASPAVAGGKVVTLGVRGTLSCLNAADGKVLWRKDEFGGSVPRFFTSSSPVIVDGLAVAQLGGQGNGALVAYDLNSGEQKWKWEGDTPAYASPVLMSVGGEKLIVAETEGRIVAVKAADGKVAWETPYAPAGRGYNASTPLVDGQTLIFSGSNRGTKAVRIEKEGDAYAAKELWHNPDASVQFNTPVLKDGGVYGLSASNELFCLDAKDGKQLWTAPAPAAQGGGGFGGPRGGGPGGAGGPRGEQGDGPGGEGRRGGSGQGQGQGQGQGGPQGQGAGERREGRGPGGPGGPGGGRGGMRGGRGGGGYGSIIDAGPVLIALTPASELVVFEPGATFKEVARMKVAPTQTHAHPVLSKNRLYVKDQNALIAYELK